jgi:hypothetical protein
LLGGHNGGMFQRVESTQTSKRPHSTSPNPVNQP